MLLLPLIFMFVNKHLTLISSFLIQKRHIHRSNFMIKDGIKSRYTVKNPLKCTIKAVKLIGTNHKDRNFYHIVIDAKGKYHFRHGQYCGIIPPGIWPKTNRRYPPRSYSIAPLLNGEEGSFSICIKRVIPDDVSKGVCSRFLSNATPDTPINITGPFGTFCLSDEDKKNNIIFIATGTGISPIRGFLKTILELYRRGDDIGNLLLIFGIQNEETFIYHDELYNYVELFGNKLNIIPAFSKHNTPSERRYVQGMFEPVTAFDRLPKSWIEGHFQHTPLCRENEDEILHSRNALLQLFMDDRRCSIFICGRKSMEIPVHESLSTILNELPNKEQLLNNIKTEVYV